MARKYRKIDPRIWKDETFRTLNREEKLTAFYLVTAQSNRVGLYPFSPAMAGEDVGLPVPRLMRLVEAVTKALGWLYDPKARVVWIPTWWRYNPPENEKHFRGVLGDVADVPACDLIRRFLLNRKDLPEYAVALLDSYAIAMAELSDSYGISEAEAGAGTEAGTGAEAGTEAGTGAGGGAGEPSALRAEYLEDFDLWRSTLPKLTRAIPTKSRFEKYRVRRKDSTRLEIQEALQGWKFDPWEQRKLNNGFELLLRNRSQVEKFSSLYRENSPGAEKPLEHGARHFVTGDLWDTDRAEFVPKEEWKPLKNGGCA